MKIVWHHPGMRQHDWVRLVFGELVTGEIEDPDFQCFEDDTIHVVSMIFHPLAALDDYFAECRRRCSNIVLFHAGDEWFSGGCGPYRHFDNVVRELPSFFTRGAGVACIPLGSPVTRVDPPPRTPASERPVIWSFAGEIRNTRIEMVKHFGKMPGGKLIDIGAAPPLSATEYDDLLRDSVFAPCGMGAIITETWRVYEAIEAGAIPLIEKMPTLDYYRNLLGEHPIPTFGNWRQARDFATKLMHDKQALDRLQDEICGWWSGYKAKMVRDVTEMLSTSHSRELIAFGNSAVNSNKVIHESLRVAELLRHQTPANLRRRFANPIKPLRRIVLGLAGRDER